MQALQQLHEDLESLTAEQPAGVRPSLDGLDLPSLASAKGTGPRLFCGHVPKASGFRRAHGVLGLLVAQPQKGAADTGYVGPALLRTVRHRGGALLPLAGGE